MKKNFKRVICMVLALGMLLLAGCVTEEAGTTAAPNNDSTTVPSGTTPTEPTTPGGIEDEYFLPKEEGCNQITFYWDYKGDAATCSFWI